LLHRSKANATVLKKRITACCKRNSPITEVIGEGIKPKVSRESAAARVRHSSSAASYAIAPPQAGCLQSQEMSVRPELSSQFWQQYFLSLATVQVQLL
jgi:hypothetical protein